MAVDSRGRSIAPYTPTNRGGFPGGPFPRGKLPFYRQSELKVVDTSRNGYPINTTGNFQVLNIPVQGAAVYNRVGNEIEMKSLHFVGQIALTGNAGIAVNQDYLRIMIVYDRQPNGANPANADLLTDYSSAGGTTTNSMSHLNPNNYDRFKVLADIRIDINDAVAAGAETIGVAQIVDYKGEVNINRFINLKGMGVKYKASAGTVGDIASGALQLFTFGAATAGNDLYQLVASFRLRFID